MDVQTLQFRDRDDFAKAFERLASDARTELCVADPARLVLRYALGLPPLATTGGRSLRTRSRRDLGDPARGRPHATPSQR
jgi:hypothetical protein